jgi:formamidopyrimidine-DNA glycosylase
MPELPDLEVYIHALRARVQGRRLEAVRLKSPFLLRTLQPPLSAAHGRRVLGLSRLGKRIVLHLEGELFLVLHLMVSGRLQWRDRGAKVPGKVGLAAFDFDSGTLIFTEASTRKRASLHLVVGEQALQDLNRGGLEVLNASLDAFREALTRESHTLKRALTDPRLFSGIGNAYSDELLHRARLSPVKLTSQLTGEEVERLHRAAVDTLVEWRDRLRAQAGDGFPEKVTAFHEGMAVHGKFGHPCPVCGAKVQRIVYAENETNYCPGCQTGGKLLADRALSRLLKSDWPKTADELEQLRSPKP